MILVTGATGFVGRRFIKLLVKKYKPKDIVCFVPNFSNQLESSGLEILKKLKVKIVHGNLVTKEGFKNLPRTYKIIFNLAANTEVLSSDHRVNDIGMKNLLDHLEFNRNTHLVHVSTMVIFSGRSDTNFPINESTVPKPTNEYSRSKWRGEMIITNHCKKFNYLLTVIRPNTIYGMGGRSNGLIDMVKKLSKKRSILSKLNWPGKSSLIYVEDVARLLITISVKPSRNQRISIYNLDPEKLSLSQIFNYYYRFHNIKFNMIVLPNFFWKIITDTRLILYKTEKLIPLMIYNWLWRLSLLSDDVIVSDNSKIKQNYPRFVFSKFIDKIPELI